MSSGCAPNGGVVISAPAAASLSAKNPGASRWVRTAIRPCPCAPQIRHGLRHGRGGRRGERARHRHPQNAAQRRGQGVGLGDRVGITAAGRAQDHGVRTEGAGPACLGEPLDQRPDHLGFLAQVRGERHRSGRPSARAGHVLDHVIAAREEQRDHDGGDRVSEHAVRAGGLDVHPGHAAVDREPLAGLQQHAAELAASRRGPRPVRHQQQAGREGAGSGRRRGHPTEHAGIAAHTSSRPATMDR